MISFNNKIRLVNDPASIQHYEEFKHFDRWLKKKSGKGKVFFPSNWTGLETFFARKKQL